ncbi:MAG: hypothetical protein AAF772_09850 [Acidobacteriota bacterium]
MAILARAAGALLLTACVAAASYHYHVTSNRASIKITYTHMLRLSSLLQTHNPSDLSPEGIKKLVAAHGHPGYFQDGWERPLIVERILSAEGEISYQIRSLGRDGKMGDCCRDLGPYEWNEDMVLLNDIRLQAWGHTAGFRPGHNPSSTNPTEPRLATP